MDAITPVILSNGINGHNLPAGLLADVSKLREARKAGALSKATPETIDSIIHDIEGGKTECQACINAGITIQTLWNWKQVLPGFVETIAQAHKQQMAARIDNVQYDMEILDVAELDPRLAMAHLRKQDQLFKANIEVAKRRDPGTWADKQLSVNLNADVSEADVSRWFNR